MWSRMVARLSPVALQVRHHGPTVIKRTRMARHCRADRWPRDWYCQVMGCGWSIGMGSTVLVGSAPTYAAGAGMTRSTDSLAFYMRIAYTEDSSGDELYRLLTEFDERFSKATDDQTIYDALSEVGRAKLRHTIENPAVRFSIRDQDGNTSDPMLEQNRLALARLEAGS